MEIRQVTHTKEAPSRFFFIICSVNWINSTTLVKITRKNQGVQVAWFLFLIRLFFHIFFCLVKVLVLLIFCIEISFCNGKCIHPQSGNAPWQLSTKHTSLHTNDPFKSSLPEIGNALPSTASSQMKRNIIIPFQFSKNQRYLFILKLVPSINPCCIQFRHRLVCYRDCTFFLTENSFLMGGQ